MNVQWLLVEWWSGPEAATQLDVGRLSAQA